MRMLSSKKGLAISKSGELDDNPDPRAWRKVKRNSSVQNLALATRLRAFRQFARLLLDDRRITIEKLRKKLD